MVELFKLTSNEISALKDETLDGLIKFNRELKISYSAIKRNEIAFNNSIKEMLRNFMFSSIFVYGS